MLFSITVSFALHIRLCASSVSYTFVIIFFAFLFYPVPVVKWEDTVGMVAKAIDYSSSHSVVDSMTRKQDLGESGLT